MTDATEQHCWCCAGTSGTVSSELLESLQGNRDAISRCKDQRCNNILHDAFKRGESDALRVVAEWIQLGGRTPAERSKRRTMIVDALKQKNSEGRTPLALAAQVGNLDIIVELFRLELVDPDVLGRSDARGNNFFHSICSYDCHRVLSAVFRWASGNRDGEQLIGSMLTERNLEGAAPVHVAVRTSQKKTFRSLALWIVGQPLSKGDLLHGAIELNDTELLKKLLESSDVDVDWRDGSGRTPLLLAVGHGGCRKKTKMQIVKLLLEKGARLNCAEEKNGFTALHLAAKRGDQAMVDVLLNGGADARAQVSLQRHGVSEADGENKAEINRNDKRGRSALHWAALARKSKILRMLLKQGADADHRDSDGFTPLQLALQRWNDADSQPSKERHFKSIRCLIEHSDVDVVSHDGNTALHVAIERRCAPAIEALLESNCRVDVRNGHGMDPTQWAEHLYGHVMHSLKKTQQTRHADDLGVPYASGIMDKLRQMDNRLKQLTSVTQSLKRVSNSSDPPMSQSGAQGAQEHRPWSSETAPEPVIPDGPHCAADGLLELSSRIDDLTERSRRIEGLTQFLVGIPSIDAIFLSAKQGNFHFFERLKHMPEEMLQFREQMNKRDAQGFTPLHYAIMHRYVDVVKTLINDFEVDVNLPAEGTGLTAIHFTVAARISVNDVERKFREITHEETEKLLDILLTNGADSRVTDRRGWGPLHYAADAPNAEAVRILLLHSNSTKLVSANSSSAEYLLATDFDGNTPLHLASKAGSYEAVKQLIKAFNRDVASPDETDSLKLPAYLLMKNSEGMNTLDVATAVRVLRLLLKKLPEELRSDLTQLECAVPPLLKAVELNGKGLVLYLLTEAHMLEMRDAQGRGIFEVIVAASSDEALEAVWNFIKARGSIPRRAELMNECIVAAGTIGHYVCMREIVQHTDVSLKEALDWKKNHPFQSALAKRKLNAAVHILKMVEPKQGTFLHDATKRDSRSLLRRAVKRARVLTAIEKGDLVMVKDLLEPSFQMDARNDENRTSLHLAVKGAHFQTSRFILECLREQGTLFVKKFVNMKDENGQTALHLALSNRCSEETRRIVDLLLNHGAECREKDAKLRTPIHLAALHGWNDVLLKYLKEWSADSVDDASLEDSEDQLGENEFMETDEDGNDLLHFAVISGSVQCIGLLLGRLCGKKKTLQFYDKYGNEKLPLSLALQHGHLEVAAMLLERDAAPEKSIMALSSTFNSLTFETRELFKNVFCQVIEEGKLEAICVEWTGSSGSTQSVFSFLVQTMPDIAEMALNRCLEVSRQEDSEHVRVSYELFEIQSRKEHETGSAVLWPKPAALVNRTDHPLWVIKESKHFNLLTHPVVLAYISRGWISIRVFVMVYFFATLLFSATLTASALDKSIFTSPLQMCLMVNGNASALARCMRDWQSKSCTEMCQLFQQGGSARGNAWVSYVTILLGFLLLTKEAMQFVNHFCLSCFRRQYGTDADQKAAGKSDLVEVSWTSTPKKLKSAYHWLRTPAKDLRDNLLRSFSDFFEDTLRWFVYTAAIIFIIDWNGCSRETGIRCYSQWQLGALTTCFSWISFLSIASKIPWFPYRIHIVAFFSTLAQHFQLAILVVILIVAFSSAFLMLISNQNMYSELSFAMLKTAYMTGGEFTFNEMFPYAGGENEDIPNQSFFPLQVGLMGAFFVVMGMAVQNMTTGIVFTNILEQRWYWQLRTKIDHVLDLQSFFQLLRVSQPKRISTRKFDIYQHSFMEKEVAKQFRFIQSCDDSWRDSVVPPQHPSGEHRITAPEHVRHQFRTHLLGMQDIFIRQFSALNRNNDQQQKQRPSPSSDQI